jgi:RES domain-containing protein
VILFRFGSDPLRTSKQEFNGAGGLKAEGRWHILGTPVVYAANSEPLSLLEKLVHRKAAAPISYPLYIAEVPDNLLEELAPEDYPQDWRSIYPPDSTRALGNAWLESAAAVGLLVPSVLISGVHGAHIKNCLINPLHPEFHQVKLSGPISFAVDPRFPSGVESSDLTAR